MAIKFKQYVDVYDLPKGAQETFLKYFEDDDCASQNTLYHFKASFLEDEMKEAEAHIPKTIAQFTEILNFLKANDLEEIAVHYWW